MIHLLIADDEMLERAVLCKTLKKNLGDRCRIFQAENGREALSVYEREKIRIAILDIEMPGINGIEAAERIREKDKDCCIIFLTAFDEFAYARKAITVRALDYLLKPYEEQELMLVVEEAMRVAEGLQKDWERKITGEEAGTEKFQKDAVEESYAGAETGLQEMVIQYIRDNYRSELSMQDVARAMSYSEAYFCKLFKQCFGKNFTSYLTEYRVEEAKRLLEDPMVNIKEIGKAVGYGDSNYFTKVFRRVTGVSPTEYRVQRFRSGSI